MRFSTAICALLLAASGTACGYSPAPLTVPRDALSHIARIKLAAVAARLRRQYNIAQLRDEGLIASLTQACLLRESVTRNIDSILNQHAPRSWRVT